MKHHVGVKIPQRLNKSHEEFKEMAERDYLPVKRQVNKLHRKVR